MSDVSLPVDLRSDTLTKPTPAMRRAMSSALVGDDMYQEDPTVRALEEEAAALLGFEAGLFCVSGTMANEIAIAVWTRPGQEVLVEERGHPVDYELAGMAALSGVMPRLVPSHRGVMQPADVQAAIRRSPDHIAHSGLIIVENTHNMWGGTVIPAAQSAELVAVARQNHLPIHLDGARLWNAAEATGVGVEILAAGYSSVMVSLSKGLGAPVGSILTGSRPFIREARRIRKRFGGGWRQAGILAAAARVALQETPPLLGLDHSRARELAAAAAAAGFRIDPMQVETNIVMVGTDPGRGKHLHAALKTKGILCLLTAPDEVRMVTYRDLDENDIQRACQAINSCGRA
ncbi:MAG: threonine aldolase family protein [Acidobacteriota bacterium]